MSGRSGARGGPEGETRQREGMRIRPWFWELVYFVAMLLVVLGGATGYWWIGDGHWAWIDCLYMTVITVTTVGYGEMLPDMEHVHYARGFTVILLVFGTGVLVYFASTITAFVVEGELKALEQQMAASKLDTVGTVLNLVWAHASAAQSYGFLDAARKAEDAERKIRLLFQAKMTLEHAKDVWSAWKDEKVQTALRLDAKDVGVLAHSYLSAATASLQYHRALTQDRGGRGGPDAARRARGEDMDAVVLRQLGYAAQHLQDESLRGALAALGASLQSYVDASYLMASGYLRDFYEVNDQLKEKAQKQGQRPVTTAPEGSAPFSTYMDLLEYADRKARESATRSQRVLGAIPSAARFHYLAGRDQLIHAEEQQKQRSLYEFWYASALADLAVQLAVGPAGLRPVAAR